MRHRVWLTRHDSKNGEKEGKPPAPTLTFLSCLIKSLLEHLKHCRPSSVTRRHLSRVDLSHNYVVMFSGCNLQTPVTVSEFRDKMLVA